MSSEKLRLRGLPACCHKAFLGGQDSESNWSVLGAVGDSVRNALDDHAQGLSGSAMHDSRGHPVIDGVLWTRSYYESLNSEEPLRSYCTYGAVSAERATQVLQPEALDRFKWAGRCRWKGGVAGSAYPTPPKHATTAL